jgi:hypothetical protein
MVPALTCNRRIKLLVAAFLGMAVLLVISTKVVRDLQEGFRLANCGGVRVSLIGMALGEYHRDKGQFPPAYVTGKDGKPAHSWRVLLLPYLGYYDLYSRYNFNEPWDGPNNRLLAGEMPMEYRCPSARNRGPYTNYVAVVAPETMWPSERAASREDIGNSWATIHFVEIADSDIHWMEPRDLTLAEAVAGVNVNRQRGISSNHPGGACAWMVGGGRHFLRDGTSPEVLRAMLTIGGGELLTISDKKGYMEYILKEKGKD